MSSSLILCNSSKSFLYWIVKSDKKWILYDNQQWLVQWLGWEETQKHFPKPNLYQKMSQSLFGGLLASDPLQLSESWQNRYIWEVCSANQCDALRTAMLAAGIGPQNAPSSSPWQRPAACCTTNTSKGEQIGLQNFASSAIFTDLLPTTYHFFKHTDNIFAGKLLLQPAEGRKCFPRIHQILKHGFLHYRNKQTNSSLATMYWL